MDKSREKFEEAFEEITGWEAEDYPNEDYVDTLWRIWQASRAAIEIELPKSTYQRTEVQAIAEHTLHKVRNIIRDAGLKVKAP